MNFLVDDKVPPCYSYKISHNSIDFSFMPNNLEIKKLSHYPSLITYLNIMLNSFRASSVTPVVFLEGTWVHLVKYYL